MPKKVTSEEVAAAAEVMRAAQTQGIKAVAVDPWPKKRIRVLVGDREFHIPHEFVKGLDHRIGRFEVKKGTDLPT